MHTDTSVRGINHCQSYSCPTAGWWGELLIVFHCFCLPCCIGGRSDGNYFWAFKNAWPFNCLLEPKVLKTISPCPGTERNKMRIFNIHLICICKLPESSDSNVIQCNQCSQWYHFRCVNIELNCIPHGYVQVALNSTIYDQCISVCVLFFCTSAIKCVLLSSIFNRVQGSKDATQVCTSRRRICLVATDWKLNYAQA